MSAAAPFRDACPPEGFGTNYACPADWAARHDRAARTRAAERLEGLHAALAELDQRARQLLALALVAARSGSEEQAVLDARDGWCVSDCLDALAGAAGAAAPDRDAA